MRGEGGPKARPRFPIQVRAVRPYWTGRRPAVPSGLESARQLMAAAPLSREGVQGERVASQVTNAGRDIRNRPILRHPLTICAILESVAQYDRLSAATRPLPVIQETPLIAENRTFV